MIILNVRDVRRGGEICYFPPSPIVLNSKRPHVVWSSTTNRNINKLKHVQNFAARIITRFV